MPVRFKITPIDDDAAEIKIVVPSPGAVACDLQGPEAVKRLTKWLCSYVAGIAFSYGLSELEASLHHLNQISETSLTHLISIKKVLEHLQKERCSLDDLKEHPPEGVDPDVAVDTASHLLGQHVIDLDEDSKLHVPEN